MNTWNTRTAVRWLVSACAALLLSACGSATVVELPAERGPRTGKGDGTGDITSDWERGVEQIWLQLDLEALSGRATITVEAADSETISLEAGGLTITDVFDDEGPIEWEHRDGGLHIELGERRVLSVDYTFSVHNESDGLSSKLSTFLWPTWCGNLFPCRSEPADGMRFELSVTGYPDGQTAIYPAALPADAPSYTLALAVGDYTCHELGRTQAGTGVSVCWLPGGKTDAVAGTPNLVAAFDWLETTIGPYQFGSEVASVAVDWGKGAAGGMEHHPLWHVAVGEMDSEITHVHEAVHGWFGTGIRLECWEDLVLSEGTTSYLAARALAAVTDAATEKAIWDAYRADLLYAVKHEDVRVLPDTCGEVDLLVDGLWSNVVYMKGAFFFRAVAQEVGVDVLDSVLAGFYADHAGKAARMTDLLLAIEAATSFDPTPLADHWLRTEGNPF